ncbi:glycosyltransferase [Clostridium sp. DJ247]|nr:glycosyltransferase [Clostridium sp. DJ247]
MAIKDTIECVESILNNIDYNNYNIIIVDNNSSNNSGIELQQRYLNNKNIYVILSKTNLGFAKGNNLGYIYAKNELKSDFIILINNDTIINQSNFIDLAIGTFNRTHYYVLGPDIISMQGNLLHQNPQRIKGLTKKEVKELIKILDYGYIKLYLQYIMHIQFIIKILKKMFRGMLHKDNQVNNKNENLITEELENIQLHGACIILSNLYIKYFDYAFFPETYMYMEEDILYYLCMQNNFKTIYNPKMKIFHKEDVSTDSVINSDIKKSIFIFKHSRNSARILYRLMKQNI